MTIAAHNSRATVRQVAALLVASALFVVEKVRVVHDIGVAYTTEDQTIYWYVVADYIRGRFYEPLFYGSPYSSHIESLLALPLVAAGVTYAPAIQVVTAVMSAAPFVLLAAMAWRRGHRTSAILVLCGQFLLPVELGALATQAAQPTAASIGGIAAALLFSRFGANTKVFLFALVGAFALCLHPNAIYVLAPAGLYLVSTQYRRWRFWVCLVPPAVAVVVAHSFAVRFYTEHPEFSLHTQWPLEFQWSAFIAGISNLDRHLGDVTPTAFRAAGFLTVLVAATAWFQLTTRDWRRTAASITLVIGVIVSLAVTKAHDGSASYVFPYCRLFYSYPLAVLWLGVLWAEVVPAPSGSFARRAKALGAVLLLATGLWRQVNLASEEERVLAVPQGIVSLVRTRDVTKRCRRLRELATAHGVDLVLHGADRVSAYGCGALWYGELDTIFPTYDRRTMNMLHERDVVRARILITEAPHHVCRTAAKHALACTVLEGEPTPTALITAPAVSALTVARWLGISVRHL
jgi:hypothetical protein